MSDHIRFMCPTCGKRLKAVPENMGKRARCACGTSVVVPSLEELPPVDEDSEPTAELRRSSRRPTRGSRSERTDGADFVPDGGGPGVGAILLRVFGCLMLAGCSLGLLFLFAVGSITEIRFGVLPANVLIVVAVMLIGLSFPARPGRRFLSLTRWLGLALAIFAAESVVIALQTSRPSVFQINERFDNGGLASRTESSDYWERETRMVGNVLHTRIVRDNFPILIVPVPRILFWPAAVVSLLLAVVVSRPWEWLMRREDKVGSWRRAPRRQES